MVQSNLDGAQCLFEHDATACTDVTGFGLLGHLVEMAKPSEVDVEVDLGAIPILDGALEMVEAGIFSSLQPPKHSPAPGCAQRRRKRLKTHDFR